MAIRVDGASELDLWSDPFADLNTGMDPLQGDCAEGFTTCLTLMTHPLFLPYSLAGGADRESVQAGAGVPGGAGIPLHTGSRGARGSA